MEKIPQSRGHCVSSSFMLLPAKRGIKYIRDDAIYVTVRVKLNQATTAMMMMKRSRIINQIKSIPTNDGNGDVHS